MIMDWVDYYVNWIVRDASMTATTMMDPQHPLPRLFGWTASTATKYIGIIKAMALSPASPFQQVILSIMFFVLVYGARMSVKKAYRWIANRRKLKTKPRRDPKTGILLIGDDDFPFPKYLHDALLSESGVTEAVVDSALGPSRLSRKSTRNHATKDAKMFKFLYVPISHRVEDFSNADRKTYVHALKKMGYMKDEMNAILQRVSEYDIQGERYDIIDAAAKEPGIGRTKAWVKKYAKLKRL